MHQLNNTRTPETQSPTCMKMLQNGLFKATYHDIWHVDNPITTSKLLLKHPRHTPGTHGVDGSRCIRGCHTEISCDTLSSHLKSQTHMSWCSRRIPIFPRFTTLAGTRLPTGQSEAEGPCGSLHAIRDSFVVERLHFRSVCRCRHQVSTGVPAPTRALEGPSDAGETRLVHPSS